MPSKSTDPARWRRVTIAAALLAACGAVAAQAGGQPWRGTWSAGYESVALPAGETMGLAGFTYAVELAPGWRVGPALYGAARGRRGGLFTWGVEGQHVWSPAAGWQVLTGLYAGGGGGASAPVGGGLMLRPHVDVLRDVGAGWALGLSWSHVRFPSGDVRSSQLGLVLATRDGIEPAGSGGLDADRLSLTIGRYQRVNRRGAPAEGAGFIVGRMEHAWSPHWAGTFEAGAAASGSADGYAEFLAGALGRWPLGPFDLGARVAVGLGGGGAVPTGGGTIAKAALLARWRTAHGWWLEAEAGHARSFGGDWRTPYAGLTLGAECCGAPAVTEVGVALQRYRAAERRAGGSAPLTAMGLVLRRGLGDTFYATGQAWGAIDGGAGAYSVGLLGLGAAARPDAAGRWRVGLEGLVGAAGGGGVSSAGGAVVQVMAWTDAALGRSLRLRLGAGAIRSVKGELSTPVAEVALSVALGRD